MEGRSTNTNGLIARAHELSPETFMKAKATAIQVNWKIDVAKCILALSGLLLALHQINLL
jgi:hypothetical protein